MKVAKDNFLKIKKNYLYFLKSQKTLGEPFYNKIDQLKYFYIPISNFIYKNFKKKKKVLFVGLSGGQGSGKTTISKIIKIILKCKFNLNVVNFSIDDFYKTRRERKMMSNRIHKLFLTRGVPGTHDINLIKKSFDNLKRKNFKSFYIPTFDKSTDERKPFKQWIKIKKRPEIVIFEGWCVGAKAQKNKELKKSINILEKNYDKNLTWRKKVNNELKRGYKKIFKSLDSLIFLKVPSFSNVYKWRLLQENKLKKEKNGKKIMSKKEIKKFIMFYQRITTQMIKDSKLIANIIINLDNKHRLSKIKFN